MNNFSKCILGLGALASGVFATYARVESMGKQSTFFMDDVSIFDNPANINVFPNFLIGELGSYTYNSIDSLMQTSGSTNGVQLNNPRYNRDPSDPWFGGLFSYSFGDKSEGQVYPQLSIGGALNRIDHELLDIIPQYVKFSSVDTVNDRMITVPKPVTNFDGFLGFVTTGGYMFGAHMYLAIQDGANVENGVVLNSSDIDVSTNNLYVTRWDVGLNAPLTRSVDGELSFGVGTVQYGPGSIDPQASWFVRMRSFITLEMIHGELVPILQVRDLQTPAYNELSGKFGVGVNASLDRGFFWLGVEGIFKSNEVVNTRYAKDSVIYYMKGEEGSDIQQDIYGTSISFGIERNIWWDWLVMRVGGKKDILFVENDANSYIYTNPIADGTPDDHVGFGVGVNIEEKLKVDATIAEDILFTGGNLLSGPHHHIISRISATYSF